LDPPRFARDLSSDSDRQARRAAAERNDKNCRVVAAKPSTRLFLVGSCLGLSVRHAAPPGPCSSVRRGELSAHPHQLSPLRSAGRGCQREAGLKKKTNQLAKAYRISSLRLLGCSSCYLNKQIGGLPERSSCDPQGPAHSTRPQASQESLPTQRPARPPPLCSLPVGKSALPPSRPLASSQSPSLQRDRFAKSVALLAEQPVRANAGPGGSGGRRRRARGRIPLSPGGLPR